MQPKYSRPVAYHEAGHVVAAHFLGIPVVTVAVYRPHGVHRPGTCGRVKIIDRHTTDRQELIFLYAGPLAEARHRKRSLITTLFAGFADPGSDLTQIHSILAEIPAKERERVEREVEKQARQLVKALWGSIRTLAEQLVNEGVVHLGEPYATAA